MRIVYMLVYLIGFLCFSSVAAAEDVRPDCFSCSIQVRSLDEPLKLAGKWLFTRDDDMRNKDVDVDTSSWPVIKTPGPWKGAYPDHKNYTVGWYRGVFEFDASLVGQDVVLLVNAYMGRVNVYVDGQEIYRRPGNINIERYYAVQPIPVKFTVTKPWHVVAIRVDTWLMTGIYQLPFEIHKYDKHDTSLAWYQFQNGELRILAAFVVFFFGLFFFLVYSKTRYKLYLVAALASMSSFPFFVAPSDVLLRVYAPEPLLFLHYTGLSSFYLAYLFSQFFNKHTPKLNVIFGVIFGVLVSVIAAMMVVPNLNLFQVARSLLFITAFFCGSLALYHSLRGAWNKRPGALILSLGIGIFYISAVHDMVLAFGLITSVSMMFSGVLSFVASMLYVASNIFADTFVENKKLVRELQTLNDGLEQLVAERTLELRRKTNDIQTMLQNMPQGVLTVLTGGIIHPEYSAYLETIFETKDIANKPMMELVFANTNLGVDILSQVDAVAGACIGEDVMNFEFNSHLMVTEFDKTMQDGRKKSIEISWSPISNDEGICEKLMLCIRDVSELKVLEAEAGQQRRELEMIGQILSVNQEKFHQFIDSSGQFIDENRAIIERTDFKDSEVITQLFRNMHTIKGNARTYGLLHLTNKVHETEQTYDNMRKNPDVDWNKELLLEQLRQTYVAIQEYAKINEVKLGRKGPGRRGGVDKFLMVQKDHVESMIGYLEHVDSHNHSAMQEVFRRVRGALRQIGTDKISDILAGVLDSLPSLAKELSKEAPVVSILDNGIRIKTQISDLLKNVFMHLLRNSMDHGIETADKRLAKGKEATGHIELELALRDGELWFRLRDDGRGLAVDMIRRKAIENGLITQDQGFSPEQTAQLIFASGFSTAEKVTEVSGRGVGMDAVKGFVQREGGSIELRFADDNVGADFRSFETVIRLPDKFAVQVEN
ncbi:MAG: Hpt domain-containing protein [Rhodoferax sp.]|nr:Hpt domain-containing protein [Rhodoferax sp.]